MLSNTDVIQIGIPRTFFGVGAINKIGDAIKDFGAEKVLVVTDKGLVAAGVADEALNAIKSGRPRRWTCSTAPGAKPPSA